MATIAAARVESLMKEVRDTALTKAAMLAYEYADESDKPHVKEVATAIGDRIRRFFETLRGER